MHETGLDAVVERVEELGGFAAVYADIDTVSATYGDLYELLVARHLLVKDRQALFEVTDLLTLTATSDDDRVLRASRTRNHTGTSPATSSPTATSRTRCWIRGSPRRSGRR